jgi:adenylate kinase
MVKNRLAQSDAQTKGWLLDGYPRSASQGAALEAAGIRPELFLLLEARAAPKRAARTQTGRTGSGANVGRRAPGARVRARGARACALSLTPRLPACARAQVPDDVLVERVVGRRLDPETGKIYHIKFAPPPAEVVSRLTVRSDDTEEKARNRLAVHARNVEAVRGMYADCLTALDGNRDKGTVFGEIATKIAALG